MKICSKCNEPKELSEFYKNSTKADKLNPICKTCTYIKQLPLRLDKWQSEWQKPCTVCKETKILAEFSYLAKGPLELSYACKACQDKTLMEKLPTEDRNRIKEHRWRQRMLELGLCTSCGKEPIFEQRSKKRCLGCLEARTVGRKAKARLWSSAGLCNGCGGELSSPERAKCDRCRAGFRRVEQRKQRRKKLQTLEMYGGECACCGEKNPWFLTIDHINRDGAEERRQIGKGRVPSYSTYLKEKRDDLQVLCFNCNCAREHNQGVCPHKIEEVEEFGFL